MKQSLPGLAALALLACGGSEPPAPPAESEQAVEAPAPPDERRRFPTEGRVAMELVEDDLLGKDFLPGGNLASYEKDGKSYQQFLIVESSPEAAALLAFEIKGALADAKFVPHFGGHFGLDGETPWFVFSKGRRVLGVVGLPQEEADAVARDFAARVE